MESTEIISKLLKLGKITQEDINEVSTDAESEIRSIAATFHAVACEKNHITVEDLAAGKPGCSWYIEEQTDNPWEMTTHARWLHTVKSLKTIIKRYKESDNYLANNITELALIVKYAESDEKMVIDIIDYLLTIR